jgi:hypothetical protein
MPRLAIAANHELAPLRRLHICLTLILIFYIRTVVYESS